jgi:hypothetical protein
MLYFSTLEHHLLQFVSNNHDPNYGRTVIGDIQGPSKQGEERVGQREGTGNLIGHMGGGQSAVDPWGAAPVWQPRTTRAGHCFVMTLRGHDTTCAVDILLKKDGPVQKPNLTRISDLLEGS